MLTLIQAPFAMRWTRSDSAKIFQEGANHEQ